MTSPSKQKKKGNCVTLLGNDLLQASYVSVVPAESPPGNATGKLGGEAAGATVWSSESVVTLQDASSI